MSNSTFTMFFCTILSAFFCVISSAAMNKNSDSNSSLKVLIVTGTFPSQLGVAVLNIITGLIDKGCDVTIYADNKGKLENAHPDTFKYDLLDKVIYGVIPEELGRYDIIFVQHGGNAPKYIELKSLLGNSTKLVVCFRGSDISKNIIQRLNIYKKLFDVADFFLPVCDYFKNKLIMYGCDAQKIETLHSSVDLEKFVFQEKDTDISKNITIVSVCRLIKKKGLEYSIKAVAQLVKKYPHISYVIVGDGKLKNELDQLIKNLGVAKNIMLVGRKSQQEVIDILQKAHIFILSSITSEKDGDQEGIPNALKEAMACGVPVISTTSAGIPELVVHKKTGLLVPERDSKAIACQIDYLIKNRHLWEILTYNARQTIEEEYDKEIVSDKIFDLLCTLKEKNG